MYIEINSPPANLPRRNATLGDIRELAIPEAMSFSETGTRDLVEEAAPWDVAMLSTPKGISRGDYSYFYDQTAGEGAIIYLVDSGCNIQHEVYSRSTRPTKRSIICRGLMELV